MLVAFFCRIAYSIMNLFFCEIYLAASEEIGSVVVKLIDIVLPGETNAFIGSA